MGAGAAHAVLDAAAMRLAEAAAFAAGTSPLALMEQAGAAAAMEIMRRFVPQPVLVACGPGNNGGDGWVAARHLAARGWPVRVAAAGPPRANPARAAAARWAGPVEPLETAAPAGLLVDALFGLGLARPLEPHWAVPLARLAAGARAVVALDLPSGIEADSGACLGQPPRATLTIAFGALKPAHCLEPGAAQCGHVEVADLGLDLSGARAWRLAQPRLPPPDPRAHKYARGAVLVLSGPPGRGGAARLAARAALRAGAGVATVACPPAAVAEHAARLDAIMVRDLAGPEQLASLAAERRAAALVLGPGLGTDSAARALAAAALALPVALLLDADIMTLFAGRPDALRRPAPTILTPHEAELARLMGGAPAGPKPERARAAAAATGALVVLKGPDTVIAAPDGLALLQHAPAPLLATAGSGDVLAGAIAGRLAAGDPPALAAAAAVWAHAQAGRGARFGLIADDLPELVAARLATCTGR